MPIWKTRSVEEIPNIKLISWSIFEVTGEVNPEKTLHFVGFNLTEGGGRTSSPIQEFDPVTGRGVTASGRVYELVGPPDEDPDGMYSFAAFLTINRISQYENVSSVVFPQQS